MHKFIKDFQKLVVDLNSQLEQGLISNAEYFVAINSQILFCVEKEKKVLAVSNEHAARSLKFLNDNFKPLSIDDKE